MQALTLRVRAARIAPGYGGPIGNGDRPHDGSGGARPQASDVRLRVLTYNILLGGRHRRALVEVVRAVAPDVLLVNESPKRPVLWRRDCQRLAAACGLRYVVGGRPAGSNMVAASARVEVRAADARVLRQPLFAPRRGIATARLDVEGHPVSVLCCHLGLDRRGRPGDVGAVLAALEPLPDPVVLGGDLNEPAGGPSWSSLRGAGLVDHGSPTWPTFPAAAPVRRIDALLVRGAEVRSHGGPVADERLLAAASDHRPVLAELSLTGC